MNLTKTDKTVFFLKIMLYLLLLKLPLRILGVVFLFPICYFYKLGEFPKWCLWFDDFRGRYINQNLITPHGCAMKFGEEHCVLFDDYNKSALKRYIWSAWRNATNVFDNKVLGISLNKLKLDNLICFSNWHLNLTENYLSLFKKYSEHLIAINYTRVVPLLFNFNLKIILGHKFYGMEDVSYYHNLGFPLEWVCSVRLRRD